MPHGHRIALVLDKLGERLGIALLLFVVAGDRGSILVTPEEELRLFLALSGVGSNLPVRRQPRAHDRDDDHQPQVGEASLPLTSAHSPWRSCECRTHCPS